jgi:hypothetical protein
MEKLEFLSLQALCGISHMALIRQDLSSVEGLQEAQDIDLAIFGEMGGFVLGRLAYSNVDFQAS